MSNVTHYAMDVRETTARQIIHDLTGEHWLRDMTDEELKKASKGGVYAVGEGAICRICGQDWLFRGPGG